MRYQLSVYTMNCKSLGDASWIAWKCFKRSDWKQAIQTIRTLREQSGYYPGPVCCFARLPTLRRTRTRILVKQIAGADI